MDATSMIQQAMQQRGMGAGATISGNPGMMAPPPAPMSPMSQGPMPPPQGGMPPMQPPMGQLLGQPPQGQTLPKPQENIIVDALIKQLERIDKRIQMGVV